MHHLARRCPVCAWLFMCGVPLLFPSISTPGQPLPPAATGRLDFMLQPAFHQWLHRAARHISLERYSKHTFLWRGTAKGNFSCLIGWEVSSGGFEILAASRFVVWEERQDQQPENISRMLNNFRNLSQCW